MKYIKKALFSASISFTLITYLATLAVFVGGDTSYALKFGAMSRFLIFSVVLGLCGLLFDIKKIPHGVARLCHFVFLCVDFGVVIAASPYKDNFRMIFISVLAFMVVYWVFVGLKALILLPFKKRSENVSEEK